MKSIVALALILLSYNQAQAASPIRRDSSGAVYLAAVTMKDASGREVFISGMAHLAPTRFYTDAKKGITAWIGKDKSDLLVMREFVTCSTSVLDNPGAVSQAAVDDVVSKSNLFNTPVALLNAQDAEVKPLVDALKLKPAECRVDLDKKTKRPAYVIDRNEAWCTAAAAHGVACQFTDFNVFLGSLNYLDADLQVDSMSPAIQVAAASLYRTGILGDDRWSLDHASASTQKFLVPGSFLMIQGRNQILMAGVQNAFSSHVKRVLIPWGAEHTVGLVQTLQTQGFHITSVKDVLLGDIQDIGKLPQIDQILTNQKIPSNYGF